MALGILNIKHPPILKDAALQQELDNEGIVSFPFLSPAILEQLVSFDKEVHPNPPVGCIKNFYVSSHSPDLDYKLKIEAEVSRILAPACEEYFMDYIIRTSAIIVKHPSPESELCMHQDWNVVDEAEFASYGLWIPLVDVTLENGAMLAIKRSHKIGPTFRHTALPSVFTEINDVASKYLSPFEAKAGSAVLFNQALLHQSTANNSDKVRTSVVNTIVHKSAKSIMYVAGSKPDQLDVYEVKPNYVQYYNSFFTDSLSVPPNSVKTGTTISTDFSPVSPEEFERLQQRLSGKGAKEAHETTQPFFTKLKRAGSEFINSIFVSRTE